MRFKLSLQTNPGAFIPFNYQYPLSSAIYKIIQSADAEFAAFLHNTGYGEGYKQFKLFTFSDIKTPFQKRGDRMQLITGEAELIICFYMPVAAENFIKGLFMNQHLEIADAGSKTGFTITAVESYRRPLLMMPLFFCSLFRRWWWEERMKEDITITGHLKMKILHNALFTTGWKNGRLFMEKKFGKINRH